MKIKIENISLVIFFSAGVIFLSGCKKDAPTYSAVPEITLESASPSAITEYKDDITFKISYTDGDGDLGENDPNVSNLYVTDNRINITYRFRIQQLAPDNANVPIKGTLDVKLTGVGITNGSSSQSVNYTIYLKDRAGNTSNSVTTQNILIHQ